MSKAKLPIGIQYFPSLIERGFTYIDKTDLLYKMITTGGANFLSRPRRFGKSLLVSALESIFKGEKELFKNCWIYSSDYGWEVHPVISLDFSILISDSYVDLVRTLQNQLEQVGQAYGLDSVIKETPSETLIELVTRLAKKGEVVILIDEYDKPILDQLSHPELLAQIRKLFKVFYATLKALGKYQRFTFLTGVTKFTQVSLFSGMNNPEDLSFNPEYATLLGFTETELDKYFSEELGCTEESRETIRQWYNGYRFSSDPEKPSVYNPISMMNYIKSGRLANYWFGTATPTFAYQLIREQNYQIPDFQDGILVGNSIEMVHDHDSLDLVTLLYQTGYLTIKDYDKQTHRYLLDFPNIEVRRSFFEHLFIYFSEIKDYKLSGQLDLMEKALLSANLEAFFLEFNKLLAAIPYILHISKEAYYHSLLFIVFKLLQFNVHAEVLTGTGRLDLIATLSDQVLLFEFKFDKNAAEALSQIEDLKYHLPFLSSKLPVILIGANFDQETRSINEWKMKKISG